MKVQIEKSVKKKWTQWGVKFKEKFCKKRVKEKRVNEGFAGWSILPISLDIKGKAPEVCPECLKKMSKNVVAKEPRTIECFRCNNKYKEKIYGIGYPGWVYLPSLFVLGSNKIPAICPDCYLELAYKLGPKFIRGTWTDLTYPSGSLLTSTKMTQNQDNFAALAAGDPGAPTIDHGILGGLADDDHAQYLNNTRHDTTDRHPRTVLKNTTASHSYTVPHATTESSWFVLTGGTWVLGLEAKWSHSDVGATSYIRCDFGKGAPLGNFTTYTTNCFAYSWQTRGADATAYIRWRYLQASPPHEIEHFIYLLVNPNDSIVAGWESVDPPWYGQGFDEEMIEKNLYYPFLNKKQDQKVILISPSNTLIEELKNVKKQFGKGILELINEGYYVISDSLEKPRGAMTEKIIAKGVEFRPLEKGKSCRIQK